MPPRELPPHPHPYRRTYSPAEMEAPRVDTSWVQVNVLLESRDGVTGGYAMMSDPRIVEVERRYGDGEDRTTVDVMSWDHGYPATVRYELAMFLSVYQQRSSERLPPPTRLVPFRPVPLIPPVDWWDVSCQVVCTKSYRVSTFCMMPAGTSAYVHRRDKDAYDSDHWEVVLRIEGNNWLMPYSTFAAHWGPPGRPLPAPRTAYDLLEDE